MEQVRFEKGKLEEIGKISKTREKFTWNIIQRIEYNQDYTAS